MRFEIFRREHLEKPKRWLSENSAMLGLPRRSRSARRGLQRTANAGKRARAPRRNPAACSSRPSTSLSDRRGTWRARRARAAASHVQPARRRVSTTRSRTAPSRAIPPRSPLQGREAWDLSPAFENARDQRRVAVDCDCRSAESGLAVAAGQRDHVRFGITSECAPIATRGPSRSEDQPDLSEKGEPG